MLSSPLQGAPIERNRADDSRCDFYGLDVVSPSSPTPRDTEARRPSQGMCEDLQKLYMDYTGWRSKASIIEDEPHLLSTACSDPVRFIDTGGPGKRQEYIVVLPWMVATVRCGGESRLCDLKESLFDVLKKMKVPQYSMDARDYVFTAFVYPIGDKEDFYDEELRLSQLHLTEPFKFLFLVAPDGLQEEKEITNLIGRAIGKSITDVEPLLSDELKQARVDFYVATEKALGSRGQSGYAHFAFPEDLEAVNVDEIVPTELINKITSSNLCYELHFRTHADEEEGNDENFKQVDVEFDVALTPYTVIEQGLLKMAEIKNEGVLLESYSTGDYLLQLVAQRSYLTGNKRPLIRYSSIRTLLEDYRTPAFVVRRKNIVLRDYAQPNPIYKPGYMKAWEQRGGGATADEQPAQMPARNDSNSNSKALWDLDDFMRVKPRYSANLGALPEQGTMVFASFAVIVGRCVLGMTRTPLVPAFNPRWTEKPAMFTTLYMKDLPPSAMLCVAVVECTPNKEKAKKLKERQKRRESVRPPVSTSDQPKGEGWRVRRILQEMNSKLQDAVAAAAAIGPISELPPRERRKARKEEEERQEPWDIDGDFDKRVLGWSNIPIFNWQGELFVGEQTLALWPGPGPGSEESNHFVALEGDTAQNPDRIGAVRITFDMYDHYPIPKILPPSEADYEQLLENESRWHGNRYQPVQSTSGEATKHYEEVNKLLSNYQLGKQLEPDEERFIWDMRHTIATYIPNALILLVDNSITWTRRQNFAELYELLNNWRGKCDIGAAFSLLDKKFFDFRCRDFVAAQLSAKLDNSCFPLYILPMIQSLKCEKRAVSGLATLLLTRALQDYRIGQKLFWLLRSELAILTGPENHEVAMRLTLMLEAYLRGNADFLKTIVKQVEMVDRLTNLSVVIKGYSEKNAATKRLREELTLMKEHLENIDSPLDSSCFLGELDIDSCRVLGSAKMPLRLTWTNESPLKSHRPYYEIIFKNGDDLRQDMLVLQMLEVMDSIWKRHKLDCCLIIYPVLPMGSNIGMIGVVPDCCTLFELQSDSTKGGGTIAGIVDTTLINKYLQNKHPIRKDYLECVDRFLMSTVAYSVATFIMGIKDRHNDNIMMTYDGRLFHIDFGHILGHGKTKLGLQRDKQPFVITDHLITVIVKGARQGRETHDMEKFKKLTVDAYMYMYDNRTLFMSLFSLMRSMKLPELSTETDLEYLKYALNVQCGEPEESEKFFSNVFNTALGGTFNTRANWFFHTVKHL